MVREQYENIIQWLRVKILTTLKEQPLTVSKLSKKLGYSRRNIHHHLRTLEKDGLVYSKKETKTQGQPVKWFNSPKAQPMPKFLIDISEKIFQSQKGKQGDKK